jgi:hypothetical protein
VERAKKKCVKVSVVGLIHGCGIQTAQINSKIMTSPQAEAFQLLGIADLPAGQ